MKIFELFKRKKDDDIFDFPQLKPLDVKDVPSVLMRKEEEELKSRYKVQSHKKGRFIEIK